MALTGLNGYELFDMINFGFNKLGVIVRVTSDSFRVLDIFGIVHQLRPEELLGKRNYLSQRSTPTDGQGNPLVMRDNVTVIEGQFQGYEGAVLHIAGQTLFLRSKRQREDAGVLAVRAKDVTLMGGRSQALRGPVNEHMHEEQTRERAMVRDGQKCRLLCVYIFIFYLISIAIFLRTFRLRQPLKEDR